MKTPAVLIAAILITALIALSFRGSPLTSHDDFADLGTVTILHTPAVARDLVIVLGDSTDIPDELRRLATHGHLIVHVPLQHFLQSAAAGDDRCINAVTLLDVFSQHLQQRFHFANYQRPILVGLDGAAPFALATAAQAPNRLLLAAAGVNPRDNEIGLPKPLCPAPGLTAARTGKRTYRITAHDSATPWHALDDIAALGPLLDELGSAGSDPDAVGDLALVELPLQKAIGEPSLDDLFVILLSGDGGWANIDKDIGEQLNRVGLPVIGWNSLQYFWSEKTPEQASRDLARTIAHYRKAWQRPRVLLIGFSLGADVLPFMISRLPADARASIADTVFLGLGHKVDFQFHVTDWIGSDNPAARPIAPELARLIEENAGAGPSMLCLYGAEDDETMCGDANIGIDTIKLPGDHHFDGDYEKATQLILDHLRRTAPEQHGQAGTPSV